MSNTKPDSQMFLEVINHFVPEVLRTMAGLTAVVGKGNPSAPQPSVLKGISGSIGLSGRMTGVVYTAFSPELGQTVAEKIFGGSASEQDVNDVVAELTNMFTGNLKSMLCDRGYNCTLTIPSIVRGDKISISAKSATISVSNTFTVGDCPDPLVVHVFAVLEN
ncbi:MAG: chemotaxis protein CheX [Spartobacteria bacterium]